MKQFFIVTIFLITALTVVDFAVTNRALSTGRYMEANPFSRWFVERPALSVPLFVTSQGGASWSLAELWKSNKGVAWAIVLGLIAFKGYILIHNAKVLR